MLRKRVPSFTSDSKIFQTYRKVRQSNTFKSSIFQHAPSERPTTTRTLNRTFQHEDIFTPDSKQHTPRVRVSDTFRHTDIFSPVNPERNSRDNSATRSRDASLHQTEKAPNNQTVNVSEFLQNRNQEGAEAKTSRSQSVHEATPSTRNRMDKNPSQWQDHVIRDKQQREEKKKSISNEYVHYFHPQRKKATSQERIKSFLLKAKPITPQRKVRPTTSEIQFDKPYSPLVLKGSQNFEKTLEPDVVKYDVNDPRGKFSRDDLKVFCKDKGYHIVKVDQQQETLSHDPTGVASFTLRINKFLNDDNEAIQTFFNDKGMGCTPENQQKHNSKSLQFQFSQEQAKTRAKKEQVTPRCEASTTETAAPSTHGKKVSAINAHRNNTNKSFERILRTSTTKRE